jgi:hypothetical protein
MVANVVAAPARQAEPTFSRSFNGPDTVWQVLENPVRSEILAHDCQPGGARDNSGFERLVIAAAAGQSVQVQCATPPIAVLDELQVRLWAKSVRPDIQLAVRIKLPRSVDLDGRTMATAIVKGTAYNRPGHWQELVVTNVPKLLAAQVRVMRTTAGADIDAREAYLDSVVLLVPGDPQGIEVATDQCEVEGVIVTRATENRPITRANELGTSTGRAAESSPVPFIAQTGYEENSASTTPTSAVRLYGATLMVEGKPFLTRAIEWNGEPLKFLAERGFNAVRLKSPPSPQQIVDAERCDLWFICTPPRPEAIDRDGLGSAGDRVLAWYLDDDALEADPAYALRWTERVRERDAVYGRPILIAAAVSASAAHDAADVLIAHDPRNSRLTGSEYVESLRCCSTMGQPGTPLWAAINTQFGDGVKDQFNALLHATGPAPGVDFEQLESLLRVACTAGVRGFVFRSSSSLGGDDPATRARVVVVELLNRRLQLMEAWLASGKVVSSITAMNGAITAAVMYVDRARLLVPVSEQPPNQTAAADKKLAINGIPFLVPGVSESSQVYFLTPVSLRTLSSERVAGGTRFVVPSANGLTVITEDPKVMKSLRQHIMRHGTQTLRLERELAIEQLKAVMQTDQRLAQLGFASKLSANRADEAESRLAQSDLAMNSGQLEQAQSLLYAAMAENRRMIADQKRELLPPGGLRSNALSLFPARLADLAALERSLGHLKGSENLLAAGDFENLGEMTHVGWQHIVHSRTGGPTHAELSADQPRSGTYCLELQAADDSGGQLPTRMDPLVWIVSPPMPLDANAVVEITGWVSADKPFTKPGSGLVIMDTIGGPELSLVVGETAGWQPFRMIRAVPGATELRLTFSLTGVGTAKVDGVVVRTLQQPAARRLPKVTGSESPASPATAVAPAPISRLPKTR